MKVKLSAFALCLVVGCSEETLDSRSGSSASATDSSPQQTQTSSAPAAPAAELKPFESHDSDSVMPPAEYYQAILKGLVDKLATRNANTDEEDDSPVDNPQLLWVNFAGAKLDWGIQRGKSFILCKLEATIPASEFTEIEQSEIIASVQKYYDDAKVKIHVVPTKPIADDYSIIHVGGTIESLGCKKNERILGIAPLDYGNRSRNDTGFAFSGLLSHAHADTVKTMATTVAHEAGHTFGLEHIENDKDIMSPVARPIVDGFTTGYVVGAKIKRFQDEPVLLRQDVGSMIPGEEDLGSDDDFKDSIFCNAIRTLQDFLRENLIGRISGEEKFMQTPKSCMED